MPENDAALKPRTNKICFAFKCNFKHKIVGTEVLRVICGDFDRTGHDILSCHAHLFFFIQMEYCAL